MSWIVSRKISFDAAHLLPNYPGKCANLHGHRWTVEVGVSGGVDPTTGFVVDFSELKTSMMRVLGNFDHSFLNEVLPNPTAENLLKLILEDFEPPEGTFLKFIRIWETPDSCAEWTRE